MPLLTVIILQYRPDFAALRRTLASLAMQTTRDFEVVVADDGSEQDYFAETKAYLEAHGIHPAAFVKAEKNGGTVKNLLGGGSAQIGRPLGVCPLAGGLPVRCGHPALAAGNFATR